jgi:hypothetical protein
MSPHDRISGKVLRPDIAEPKWGDPLSGWAVYTAGGPHGMPAFESDDAMGRNVEHREARLFQGEGVAGAHLQSTDGVASVLRQGLDATIQRALS